MPEISPDLSDPSRCISVHWSLPVQCVLPTSHRETHEAWHPHTGNRIKYRRTLGIYETLELHHGEWHALEIAPPGGYCCDTYPGKQGVRCQQQYGHDLSWQHRAVVDGCTYSWNTALPKPLTADQLSHDVRGLRATVMQLAADLERLSRPSYSERHVWQVWNDHDGSTHGYYATEDDAKTGTIDCWEEVEESCPDYSWRPARGDHSLELLVGGEPAGIYLTRQDVHGKGGAR